MVAGLAAANAVLQCMEQDQTVILPDDLYFGVLALVEKVFTRWGLNSVQVDVFWSSSLTLAGGHV